MMEGAYITRHDTGDPQTIGIARQVANSVIAVDRPGAQFSRSMTDVVCAIGPAV
jgi:hypothetical protein